jgi:hypothetical protein
VVPNYDDDEIIEDYEEVKNDSGVRRVNSAQGGPVKRPSAGVRPSTSVMPGLNDDANLEDGAPAKGKITKKSARNIWIICIVICVLGVGAVVADLIFGFTKKDPVAANNAAPRDNRGSLPPSRVETPRQKLEKEFRADVSARAAAMDASRAWDFYWTAVLEFEDAWNDAAKLKSAEGTSQEALEEGWAIAIKHYYKVRYAILLFKFHHGEHEVDYFSINISNADEMSMLPDENLTNDAIKRYQAAASKLDSRGTRINRFQPDVLKNDLTASKVLGSEEWSNNVFGEARAKYEAGTERNFDQADLEFIKGPDYKPGEKKLAEQYLESRQGD